MSYLLILIATIINVGLGALVWALVDSSDDRLLKWYLDCPAGLSVIIQPLILSLWPVAVLLWWFKLRKMKYWK